MQISILRQGDRVVIMMQGSYPRIVVQGPGRRRSDKTVSRTLSEMVFAKEMIDRFMRNNNGKLSGPEAETETIRFRFEFPVTNAGT